MHRTGIEPMFPSVERKRLTIKRTVLKILSYLTTSVVSLRIRLARQKSKPSGNQLVFQRSRSLLLDSVDAICVNSLTSDFEIIELQFVYIL